MTTIASDPRAVRDAGLQPHTAEYRRTLRMLGLAGLANFALIYYVQPLLPAIAEAFGVPPAASGLALSTTTLAMIAGLLVAAPLADRLGRVRTIAGSLVLAGVLALACAAAPSWDVFLALRAGMGVALGIMPAAALAYLRDVVSSQAHLRANATYIAGTAVGGAAGRLLPVPLALLGGWQVPTIALGALAVVVGAAIALHLRRDDAVSDSIRVSDVLLGTFRVLSDRRLLILCAMGLTSMAAFVALYNTISFRLQAPPFDLGAAEALVYLAYPLGILAPTAFRAISARVGRAWGVVSGAVLVAVALVLLIPPTLASVFAGLGLLTFAFLGIHSLLSGWVVARAHEVGLSTARASSAYLICYYAGSTVAGVVATAVWSTRGWSGVVVLAGGFAAATLVLATVAGVATRTGRPRRP